MGDFTSHSQSLPSSSDKIPRGYPLSDTTREQPIISSLKLQSHKMLLRLTISAALLTTLAHASKKPVIRWSRETLRANNQANQYRHNWDKALTNLSKFENDWKDEWCQDPDDHELQNDPAILERARKNVQRA